MLPDKLEVKSAAQQLSIRFVDEAERVSGDLDVMKPVRLDWFRASWTRRGGKVVEGSKGLESFRPEPDKGGWMMLKWESAHRDMPDLVILTGHDMMEESGKSRCCRTIVTNQNRSFVSCR